MVDHIGMHGNSTKGVYTFAKSAEVLSVKTIITASCSQNYGTHLKSEFKCKLIIVFIQYNFDTSTSELLLFF